MANNANAVKDANFAIIIARYNEFAAEKGSRVCVVSKEGCCTADS